MVAKAAWCGCSGQLRVAPCLPQHYRTCLVLQEFLWPRLILLTCAFSPISQIAAVALVLLSVALPRWEHSKQGHPTELAQRRGGAYIHGRMLQKLFDGDEEVGRRNVPAL